MPLSSQRKAKCLSIIHTLLSFKISQFFAHPVDPVVDECPNYSEIVKRPMDFETVERNLENDVYDSFTQFKQDVELIFANATSFNGKDSFIGMCAAQVKMWFKQLSAQLTDDESLDWAKRFEKLSKDVERFSQKMIVANSRNIHRNEKVFAQSSPESSPPPAKTKSAQRRPPRPKVSNAEITEIYQKIYQLTDRDEIIKVIDIIKQNDPACQIGEDSTIDINLLAVPAKVALKDMFKDKPLIITNATSE